MRNDNDMNIVDRNELLTGILTSTPTIILVIIIIIK